MPRRAETPRPVSPAFSEADRPLASQRLRQACAETTRRCVRTPLLSTSTARETEGHSSVPNVPTNPPLQTQQLQDPPWSLRREHGLDLDLGLPSPEPGRARFCCSEPLFVVSGSSRPGPPAQCVWDAGPRPACLSPGHAGQTASPAPKGGEAPHPAAWLPLRPAGPTVTPATPVWRPPLRVSAAAAAAPGKA